MLRFRNACLSAELTVQASIKGRMYPLLLKASGFLPGGLLRNGTGHFFSRSVMQ
jgi:hypothetical protein